MRQKKIVMIGALILAFNLLIMCGKKDDHKTGEIAKDEQAGDEGFVGTIKAKPINYDSMFAIIAPLVDAVKNNPENIELRKQLVAVSYDTTWETILSAGTGIPMEHAATESIAMKYAEKAAAADAYRWAIYIKKWKTEPAFPDIDKIEGEIQGKIVARQDLPDKRVSVLVEVQASKLP
ncbi:MAG: hypothetical protein MUC94_18610 [bacterium]|nr:hypothetical protein [bacterium]